MLGPVLERINLECLVRREGLRFEEPPKAVVRVVLSHVRRGGQQQQMLRVPGEAPSRSRRWRARDRLGKLVTLSLGYLPTRLSTYRQFVRLVEYGEVVRIDDCFAETRECGVASQRIQTNDNTVAIGTSKRIAGPDFLAADDSEFEPEERSEFALPVTNQARRHNYKDAPD